jgi:hypothetical protein
LFQKQPTRKSPPQNFEKSWQRADVAKRQGFVPES